MITYVISINYILFVYLEGWWYKLTTADYQNIVDKEDVAIALLLVVVFLYNWSNFLSLF